MRLTCPNCSARYEVDDSMIPPEGRDVQCSNCSTTWFQPGRRTDHRSGTPETAPEPAPAAVPEASEPAPPPPPTEAAPASTPQRETPPEAEAAPEPVASAPDDLGEADADTSEAAQDEGDESIPAAVSAAVAATAQAAAERAPQRREMDPAIRNILREEAEREAQLRRSEAQPVETQSEMPLTEEPDDTHRARRRADLEAAEDAFEAEGGDPHSASRKDLLPDIEEINSTLRSTGDRSQVEGDATDIDTVDAAPRRRRGVRIGFMLVLVVAAGGAALYSNADRISAAIPQASAAIEGFVSTVNATRFWLDDMARSLAGGTEEG